LAITEGFAEGEVAAVWTALEVVLVVSLLAMVGVVVVSCPVLFRRVLVAFIVGF
jgi:hypothetical protein